MNEPKVLEFYFKTVLPKVKEWYIDDGKSKWDDKMARASSLRTKLENELLAAFPLRQDHNISLSLSQAGKLEIEMPEWFRAALVKERSGSEMVRSKDEGRGDLPHAH